MADIPCLPELELCSPWFDASAPRLGTQATAEELPVPAASANTGPPQLLLLLAPPRSGSHHLSRLLWLHGYGRPLEYLNPHLRQPLARFSPGWPHLPRGIQGISRGLRRRLAPERRPWAWWQRLVAERSTLSRHSGHPFFAIKLQRGQAGTDATALHRTFAPLAQRGLWPSFDSTPPAVIGLFRRDWQRAVVSHHLSLCTGAFDQGRIVSFQHRPITCLGHPEALAEDLAAYRLQLEWLLACVEQSGFPALVIAHEALVRDQETVLAALIRAIDPQAPCEEVLRRHRSLSLRIARERSAWVGERETWLNHLQQEFLAAGLDRHPDAREAQALVERLEERARLSSR
jgi:LPS sulfotransferase NodH